MEYSLLKYPKKSHRKIVNIPNESTELAELFGIVFGDGGINNDWQLVITLNSVSDLEYSQYVDNLLRRLFKIDVHIRKRPSSNALVLVSSGSNLVDFLVSKGAVRGNKIVQQIDTPSWINSNLEYQKAFVRGLVDTDGCLFVHNHTVKSRLYHNIGFCFTNSSEKLVISVAEILKKFGINPHITDEGRRIYLYSVKSVTSYLDVFGSSNPRVWNKYSEWLDANKNKDDNISELHIQNVTRRGAGVA
ncbi:hypothetical protein KJ836_00235 [Patescibacteria group bacterium]|nr:hypothetical protein [Patescibacteria group bacterium]